LSEGAPDWSPDGNHIAFIRELASGGLSLWVMTADGSNRRALPTGDAPNEIDAAASRPAWSPSGTELAFVRWTDCDPCIPQIFKINVDGTGLRQVSHIPFEPYEGDIGRFSWSHDGSKLLFSAKDRQGWEVYTINWDGSGLARLTNVADASWSGAYDAIWSPDGREIAMNVYSVSDGFDIYTMRADGTDRRLVTSASDADASGAGEVFKDVTDWQPIPGPKRGDYKNSAQFCKAEQAFWGGQFASRYGGAPNAYGKCVSQSH
jgi:Tol biopolymer transport system component